MFWRSDSYNAAQRSLGAGMKRRQFITVLGGAMAWPRVSRAQQPAMPVIGFLSSRTPDQAGYVIAAFRQGLEQAGYVEGRNVGIEFRFADGQNDRLPELAADLVRRQVAVIVAGGTSGPAKQATTRIPIVFTTGSDPVVVGLVTSISRPNGNLTGATFYSAALIGKQLELLREIAPRSQQIGLLINPKAPSAESEAKDALAATHALGLQLHVFRASTESELETAFASLARLSNAALLVGVDPYFDSRAERLVALAARYKVPTVYNLREYVVAGGLISYGASITDAYRQAGLYAGRIVKGEKPGELPVQFPTRFELVINLKTAREMGLTITPALLARADEVIE
jgi:putative ABC transport system substrate-binding protein